MGELAGAMRMLGNLGLHVIKYPSGKYGFVGRVPAVLAYIHDDGTCPTHEECKDIHEAGRPALVLKRYGIKTRVFDTQREALLAAEDAGFDSRLIGMP